MDNHGYMRVAAIVPSVVLANPAANLQNIIDMGTKVTDAAILVFPELSLTGYTCGDLFHQTLLLKEAEKALSVLTDHTRNHNALWVIGLPIEAAGALYNCAAVIGHGEIKGLVPKSFLPNYNEYYERRWFSPAPATTLTVSICGRAVPLSSRLLFAHQGATIGVEICEDLWVPAPPSTAAALAGADVIVNLSATNEVAGKHAYLLDLVRQQSARLHCAYIYASAGWGESSTDAVFAGNGLIMENGRLLASTKRFSDEPQIAVADIDLDLLSRERIHAGTFADNKPLVADYTVVPSVDDDSTLSSDYLLRPIERLPFVPQETDTDRCAEVANIQIEGLRRRLSQLEPYGSAKAVVGISGGLDSTLALLVTVEAFRRQGLPITDIYAITMPGFGTTDRTHSNAWHMMTLLGVTALEIPIGHAATTHLHDLGHDGVSPDLTYENAQARERTQVLMDYANKVNGIVIGTGDLSELALGWCTYNGDHMSMYGVNASVPKTLVRFLVKWFADNTDIPNLGEVLTDVLNTPVSPELVPADQNGNISQKTEDIVGPYELHDFFLYQVLRFGFTPDKIYRLACQAFKAEYTPVVIRHWLRMFFSRFFSQQFKRSCMPDGPKVGSACLSPRADWKMPSDASASLWLKQIETL